MYYIAPSNEYYVLQLYDIYELFSKVNNTQNLI